MENNYHVSKYINPMVDYGFKKIFRESGKTQLLIRPLNAIFGLDIAELEIGEAEHLGETPEDRNACFDFYCTASDGKKFIVEVQLARQEHFLERALYYTTFPISQSALKGRWGYDFPPVFFLGLLNFDFHELPGQSSGDSDTFIHRFSLRNDLTGERMTDRLQFAFLEIRRFNKPFDECNCFEDKFLYIMKNLPTFAKRPELWDDPYFVSMLDEAEYARMTRQEKEQYRNAMKREWDYWNTIDYARKEGVIKGREEGLEQGRAEGHEEGLTEGLEKGRAEGIAQEQRAIAMRLLAAGLSEELIASSTTLSIEQVRALQNA